MNNEIFNRIYSLNLASFIIYKTGNSPALQRDEDNGLYYCVFEECDDAIVEYKDYSKPLQVDDLRCYLRIFKNLKKQIKNMKVEE